MFIFPFSSTQSSLLTCLYVVREIVGTFNATTANNGEKTFQNHPKQLGQILQKKSIASLAQGWQKWVSGNDTTMLAKFAFNENVELGKVVEPVSAGNFDGSCDELWNKLNIVL